MEGYTVQRMLNVLDSETMNIPNSLLDREITGISTDTRTIGKGDVFFALNGEHYDGADFIDHAVASGAIAAVVNADSVKGKNVTSPAVLVNKTVRALGSVAEDYRADFTGKVIAVTGTNGKTTVKEMLISVLSSRWRVHGTKGNYNNQIGVPLSVFGLKNEHDCAVFELGMSAPGEISYLGDIVKPDIGVILNVGPGHMEFFNGLAKVAEAKMELLDVIAPDGIAVINGDDEFLSDTDKRFSSQIVRFGLNRNNDYHAENIEIQQNGCARFDVEGRTVQLAIPGFHNVYNALAAYTVARILEVDRDSAALSLEAFKAPAMRMEIFEKDGIHFINDSYNANPLSMKAAASVLRDIRSKRKIAVLGDMLELGETSGELHRKTGELFGAIGLDLLCLIGDFADNYYMGAVVNGMNSNCVKIFSDIDSAVEYIASYKQPGDMIFVKGSRALRMERIIEELSEAI